MEISLILFIILLVAGLIWIMVGIKSHQHKRIAVLLILLLLFFIYGFKVTFIDKNIAINNIEDFGNATKLYFSWLGNVFNNLKIITTQAIKMNWQGNKTA